MVEQDNRLSGTFGELFGLLAKWAVIPLITAAIAIGSARACGGDREGNPGHLEPTSSSTNLDLGVEVGFSDEGFNGQDITVLSSLGMLGAVSTMTINLPLE